MTDRTPGRTANTKVNELIEALAVAVFSALRVEPWLRRRTSRCRSAKLAMAGVFSSTSPM